MDRKLKDETEEPQMRIVPRGEHIISRKNIDSSALKVLYRLHNHGYKAYLVGGSVRDLQLRKTPKDFDIATDARPNQVKRLFANCRLIGRRFRLAHILFRDGQIIEVSTFRKKAEFVEQDGDSPVVRSENTFGTPDEDANRRDITINGMFYNIADFTIIDYVGGLEDLKNRFIRVIGDARERLLEDPVRMIRVIRHAVRTGFDIDPVAFKVIREEKSLLTQCSPARVKEEFFRELRGGWSSGSIPVMIDTGLLFVLFPEYEKALAGEKGPVIKERLFSNLKGLDLLVSSGQTLSDQEVMAAFLSPLTEHFGVYENLPPGRKAMGVVNHRIRDNIKEVVRNIWMSRGNAEIICYMLIAQYSLKRALGTGDLPKIVVNKVNFGAGVRLYQIEAVGRGESTPKMFIEAALRKKVPLLQGKNQSNYRKGRRQGEKNWVQKTPPEQNSK